MKGPMRFWKKDNSKFNNTAADAAGKMPSSYASAFHLLLSRNSSSVWVGGQRSYRRSAFLTWCATSREGIRLDRDADAGAGAGDLTAVGGAHSGRERTPEMGIDGEHPAVVSSRP